MRTHSSSQIDHSLRAIALDQLGLVTAAQAARVGIQSQRLSARCTAGLLQRVFPNVYALSVSRPPFQRELAAALAVAGSTVTGPSAALIHGFPITGLWKSASQPVVLAVDRGQVVRLDGIRTVRNSPPRPSKPWFGVRLATPAATIAMLPQFADNSSVERCLDHALAAGLASTRAIVALVETLPYRSVQGRAMLLELLEARTSGVRHRSKDEQRVGKWLTQAGLSGWVSNYNVSVPNRAKVEVDFAWPAERVALEVSPFFTHGSRVTQDRDVVRRRLLLQCGWRVAEATDPDLETRASFDRVVAVLRLIVR